MSRPEHTLRAFCWSLATFAHVQVVAEYRTIVAGRNTKCTMRMLISNDDAIYSPGLAVLADVAAEFGEVRIVAPDVEQSSMGKMAGYQSHRCGPT